MVSVRGEEERPLSVLGNHRGTQGGNDKLERPFSRHQSKGTPPIKGTIGELANDFYAAGQSLNSLSAPALNV